MRIISPSSARLLPPSIADLREMESKALESLPDRLCRDVVNYGTDASAQLIPANVEGPPRIKLETRGVASRRPELAPWPVSRRPHQTQPVGARPDAVCSSIDPCDLSGVFFTKGAVLHG